MNRPGRSRARLRPPARLHSTVLALLASCAAAGCRPTGAPEPPGASQTVERGPLRVTVEARPSPVWVGQELQIELRADAPTDWAIALPDADALRAALGGPDGGAAAALTILSVDTPDPRPAGDDRRVWRRTFTLVPYVSGEMEIPALPLRYGRPDAPTSSAPAGAAVGAAPPATRPGAPALESELFTPALKIPVRSALTTQDSVEHPRDITGALGPTTGRRRWPWVALAALAGGLAGLGWWGYRRWRRRARRGPPPLAPELWALTELARLSTADVDRPDRAREFYYQLTGIVRHYVERKFGLAAPEMTSEEFLMRLSRERSALPYDRDRLGAFLERCDLVKYAALQPTTGDAEEALRAARAFIHATAAASAGGEAPTTRRPEAA